MKKYKTLEMLGLKNSHAHVKRYFIFLFLIFFSTIHPFRFYRRLKLVQNKFLHVQYCFEMFIGIKRIKELIKIHPLVDMLSCIADKFMFQFIKQKMFTMNVSN